MQMNQGCRQHEPAPTASCAVFGIAPRPKLRYPVHNKKAAKIQDFQHCGAPHRSLVGPHTWAKRKSWLQFIARRGCACRSHGARFAALELSAGLQPLPHNREQQNARRMETRDFDVPVAIPLGMKIGNSTASRRRDVALPRLTARAIYFSGAKKDLLLSCPKKARNPQKQRCGTATSLRQCLRHAPVSWGERERWHNMATVPHTRDGSQ